MIQPFITSILLSITESTLAGRLKHAVRLVACSLAAVCDTLVGLGFAFRSLDMEAGRTNNYREFYAQMGSLKFLLPIQHILGCINPGAPCLTEYAKEKSLGRINTCTFFRVAEECRRSKNLFRRHVSARVCYLLMAINAIVARSIDLIEGVVAAVVAIALLGTNGTINKLAIRGLSAPLVLRDLTCCFLGCINPGLWVAALSERQHGVADRRGRSNDRDPGTGQKLILRSGRQ